MEFASFEIEGCECLLYLCSTGFLFQFISENTSGYFGLISEISFRKKFIHFFDKLLLSTCLVLGTLSKAIGI